jgi:hypothetical protein
MEIMLLREQNIVPTKEVLENVLGESYPVYVELIEEISNPEFGLLPEWRYYKDGNAWLCKVCYKKKTVFWLSVWDKYFRIVFYFTEKTCTGINELDIKENIKEEFIHAKHIGKLIPLIIRMKKMDQIDDAIKIISYKKKLK